MKTLLALLALTLAFAGDVAAQDRMPAISAEKMTDQQKKAVADYKAIRNTDLTGPPWTVLCAFPISWCLRCSFVCTTSRTAHSARCSRRWPP